MHTHTCVGPQEVGTPSILQLRKLNSQRLSLSLILCEVEEELESNPKALVYVHSETLSFQMIE